MLFLKFQKHTGESCVREQKKWTRMFLKYFRIVAHLSVYKRESNAFLSLRNCPAHIGNGCFTIPTLYPRVNVSVSVKCSTEAERKNFIPKYDVCHLKGWLASRDGMAFAVPPEPERQHAKTHQKMRLWRRFFWFGPNVRWCFFLPVFGKKKIQYQVLEWSPSNPRKELGIEQGNLLVLC